MYNIDIMSIFKDKELSIKVASVSEKEILVDRYREAARWIFELTGMHQWHMDTKQAGLEKYIDEGNMFIVSSPDVNEPVASFVLLDDEPSSWEEAGVKVEGTTKYFSSLQVTEGFRGIGSEIVSWAEKKASDEGVEYMTLDVVSDNQRLLDYYQELGYGKIGEASVIDHEGNPLSLDLFKKALTS